jgi:hypothetical protein
VKRTIYISKERKRWIISFGNDDSTKIIGKSTIKLGSKNVKVENVLLVEDMNNNLLSAS